MDGMFFYPEASLFISLRNMAYDWRVRLALKYPKSCSTNLASVFLDDKTLQLLGNPDKPLGYKTQPPILARHVYGRLIRELSAQGAKGIAMDVLFKEHREDLPFPMTIDDAKKNGFTDHEISLFNTTRIKKSEKIVDGVIIDSDEFFAVQMRKAGNVVIAAEHDEPTIPFDLFLTNAYSVADITSDKDSDGKFRRLYPYRDYRIWNVDLQECIESEGYKMNRMTNEMGRLVFYKDDIITKEANRTNFVLPLDANGCFTLANLPGFENATNVPPLKPYELRRYWHMGIVMAAKALGLDIDKARIDKVHNRIHLSGNGIERVIPLDQEGRMLIDWSFTSTDENLTHLNFGSVLWLDAIRNSNQPEKYHEYLEVFKKEGLHLEGEQSIRRQACFCRINGGWQ